MLKLDEQKNQAKIEDLMNYVSEQQNENSKWHNFKYYKTKEVIDQIWRQNRMDDINYEIPQV